MKIGKMKILENGNLEEGKFGKTEIRTTEIWKNGNLEK